MRIRRNPPAVRRAIALLVLVACAALACTHGTPHLVARRDGPPFAEAFGEASDLLDIEDVPDARARLAHVVLPDDQAFFDDLLARLAETDAVSTERILLLADAVPVPPPAVLDLAGPGTSGTVTVRIDGELVYDGRTPREEELRFLPVLRRILLDGARRWADPSPAGAGRLLDRVPRTEDLAELAAIVLPACDDGSPGALAAVLDAMDSSTRRAELVTGVLLPDGRLAGREATALDHLAFDSDREAVLTALVASRDAIAMDELLDWTGRLSFDSTRVEVVRTASDRLAPFDGSGAVRLLSITSFDSSRNALLDLVADRLEPDGDDVISILSTFSMDGDRVAALRRLVAGGRVALDGHELVAVLALASFDSHREEMLGELVPGCVSGLDGDTARSLLLLFSFDSSRLEALEHLAATAAGWPAATREALAGTFSGSSDREAARRRLGL